MRRVESTLAAKSPFLLSSLLTLSLSCAGGTPPPGAELCAATDEGDLATWASNPPNAEDCVLEIRNTSLTSLDALDGLERVNGFILEDNSALRDIDVLGTIEPFPILTVRRSPLSADLDVSNVIDDVRLEGTEVVNVAGTQTNIALLHVRDGALVESLSFPNLVSLGSLNIEADPLLEEIAEAFPNVTGIQRLSVTNTPLVTTAEIEALATRGNVPAAELFHCGNADDEACEDVPPLD